MSTSKYSRSIILIGCTTKITEPANQTFGYRLNIEIMPRGGVVFYPKLGIVSPNDLH